METTTHGMPAKRASALRAAARSATCSGVYDVPSSALISVRLGFTSVGLTSASSAASSEAPEVSSSTGTSCLAASATMPA